MLAAPLPSQGQLVHVHFRQHLVEQVVLRRGEATLERLSCLDDDRLGEQTCGFWECEVSARVIDTDPDLFHAPCCAVESLISGLDGRITEVLP